MRKIEPSCPINRSYSGPEWVPVPTVYEYDTWEKLPVEDGSYARDLRTPSPLS